MDPRGPLDQAKPKMKRAKKIVYDISINFKKFINYFNNTLFIFLMKFSVLVFLICIIAPIIIWIFSESSIVVYPLVIGEVGSNQNFREEPITELLCLELQGIKDIFEQDPIKRNSSFKSPATQSRTNTVGNSNFIQISSFTAFDTRDEVLNFSTHPTTISTFTPELHSIGYHISQLGNVATSGISLSLGQLIITFKELTHNQGQTISGSLQQYGSNLCLVVILDDPESYGGAYEVRRTITKNNSSFEDLIPGMIEDISFQIAHDICMRNQYSKNIYPQTWQAFRNFTRGLEAYYMYNITESVKDLDRSSRMILLAKKSEPHCLELDNMLFNLGLANLNIDRYDESICLFRNISKSQSSANHYLIDAAATWNNKGIYLFNQGKLNDSIKAFDAATELNPEYAGAWNNKGISLSSMRRYNDSIQAFDMVIILTEDKENTRRQTAIT